MFVNVLKGEYIFLKNALLPAFKLLITLFFYSSLFLFFFSPIPCLFFYITANSLDGLEVCNNLEKFTLRAVQLVYGQGRVNEATFLEAVHFFVIHTSF